MENSKVENSKKVRPQYSEALGWWVNVKDADSANYAIRMSGLPIFLMGVNFFVASLVAFLTWNTIQSDSMFLKAFLLAMFPIGLSLIVCGILLRKNNNKIAPLAAGLYIPFVLISLFFVTPAPDIGKNTMLVINMLFTLLMMLLSLGGLRGWRWLRDNA